MGTNTKLQEKIQKFVVKLFKIKTDALFVTRPGPDTNISKYITDRQKKENAELQAKLLDANAKLEKIVKEKHRKKDEGEERERLTELKKIIEKPPNTVTFKLISKKKTQLPRFFLKSNKTYKNYKWFYGIQYTETDDGYPLLYILLTDKKKVVRFLKPAGDFKSCFKEELGVVSQLMGGKFDSMFDVYEGKPVLATPTYEDQHRQPVEIIHLEEQEKQKYDQLVELYKTELGKANHALKEAGNREVKYQNKLGSDEIDIERLTNEVDAWKATAGVYNKKYDDAFQTFLDSEVVSQSLLTASTLDSKLVEDLQESLRQSN